jgi:hypothetical protein
MEREYFCLVNVEISEMGGVQKRAVGTVIDADPDRTDAAGLYQLAVDQVREDLVKWSTDRWAEPDPGGIVVTGFTFYLNTLPR